MWKRAVGERREHVETGSWERREHVGWVEGERGEVKGEGVR